MYEFGDLNIVTISHEHWWIFTIISCLKKKKGHLYVAFSRVRRPEQLRLYVGANQAVVTPVINEGWVYRENMEAEESTGDVIMAIA